MIALVDADILMFRVAWAKNSEEDFEVVKDYMREYWSTIATSTKATSYIGFLTGKRNFRFDIAQTLPYKGNRTQREKPVWKDKIRDLLVETYHCVVVDGMEADDSLSITQRQLNAEGIETVIVSTDKDLLQIPGNHFNFVKQEWVNVDNKLAKYNLWKQVLMGDLATDNIQGIPGIGPKKAEYILKDLVEGNMMEGTLYRYVHHFGEYKGIQKFTENYYLLKLLEEKEGFIIPNVTLF